MSKPPARKIARDRLCAALHEAGHVVVARYVGVTVGKAYIYPVPEIWDDRLSQKTWLGDTKMYPDFDNPSPQQLAMVGVAGAVAQLCWRREAPVDEQWQPLMSGTDWGICFCKSGKETLEELQLQEAVSAVYVLLKRKSGRLWRQLYEQARRLEVARTHL